MTPEEQTNLLKTALRFAVALCDGVDNGSCRICHAPRFNTLRGNPGVCQNRNCISHTFRKATRV